MKERKFDYGPRIDTSDQRTLERSVGSNIFESFNDGLVSKPVTPWAAGVSGGVCFADRYRESQRHLPRRVRWVSTSSRCLGAA